MAGDLPFRERLVILTDTDEEHVGSRAAESPVPQARVVHRYGDRVRVTAEPAPAEPAADVPSPAAEGLSEVEAIGLAATRLRFSPAYVEAKRNRPRQGEAWDTAGGCTSVTERTRPQPSDRLRAVFEESRPWSAYLEGSVAVGLVIVEGPTDDLRFSVDERIKVVAEVQNALSYYAMTNPAAGLSFTYDIHTVPVDVPADPAAEDLEGCWRNPAMDRLGYDASWEGVRLYLEDIRTRFATRWTYCAFITKYPLWWFAYAYMGGPYLVMDYYNDGWGVENIDRVFAHETGHIFNAPDEYASSWCSCEGQYGRWNKPNPNCENCAPNGGVPCIMKGNDWSMCTATPAHLGWMPARLIAKHSGKALDVGGSQPAHGAAVVQWAFHGGDTQMFRPDEVGGGYVRLVAHDSDQVLGVAAGGTEDGTPLILEDWHGADNQLFRIEPLGDGYVSIRPRHAPTKVLDAAGGGDGAGLVLWQWKGWTNQRWLLTAPLVASHSGKVMAVAGGSIHDGTPVVQWDYAGRGEQILRPEPVGDGYVKFVCQHSGKVLDVYGASTEPAARLVQRVWNGSDNQKFRIDALGDGNCRITAKHSRLALTVTGEADGNGAAIVQQPWTGSARQRWLVPYFHLIAASAPARTGDETKVRAGIGSGR